MKDLFVAFAAGIVTVACVLVPVAAAVQTLDDGDCLALQIILQIPISGDCYPQVPQQQPLDSVLPPAPYVLPGSTDW